MRQIPSDENGDDDDDENGDDGDGADDDDGDGDDGDLGDGDDGDDDGAYDDEPGLLDLAELLLHEVSEFCSRWVWRGDCLLPETFDFVLEYLF